MEQETYFIDTGKSKVYFNVTDGTVSFCGKVSSVPYDKFITFIQTARELGLAVGKIKMTE